MGIGLYHNYSFENVTVSMGIHEEPFADTSYTVYVDFDDADDEIEIECDDYHHMVETYELIVAELKKGEYERSADNG